MCVCVHVCVVLEGVAALRGEYSEVERVWLEKEVFLAADLPPLPQSLVPHYHISMTVDWKHQE